MQPGSREKHGMRSWRGAPRSRRMTLWRGFMMDLMKNGDSEQFRGIRGTLTEFAKRIEFGQRPPNSPKLLTVPIFQFCVVVSGTYNPLKSARSVGVKTPSTRRSLMTHVGNVWMELSRHGRVIGALGPPGLHSMYGRRSAASPKYFFCCWQCSHQDAP